MVNPIKIASEYLKEASLDLKGFEPCDKSDLVKSPSYYRGASMPEVQDTLRKGHAVPSKTKDLIGNDWTALEFAFKDQWEGKNWSDEKIEKYMDGIIPTWAVNEGVNLTTDFEAAKGFAEKRSGVVMVFDFGSGDTFEAAHYTQVRDPGKAKLKGLCLLNGKCYKKF